MSLYPSESSTAGLKFTPQSCREKKRRGEKIACLTAYDYAFARLFDESGIDVILVGDSWGMTAGGYESTLPVTMDEMLIAVRAVRRGVRRALVVADMPYGSFHQGNAPAVANAIRMVKEAGAEAVKIEGGAMRAALVSEIVAAEIPVMGHIGLTPQSVLREGGYRVQGAAPDAAARLLADAQALERAGVFALVLEGIPRELAAVITARVPLPTIGIGAGPDCDGQVLVMHDLLGLSFRPRPRFARAAADLGAAARAAAETFRQEVESGAFPSDGESYHMPAELRANLAEKLR